MIKAGDYSIFLALWMVLLCSFSFAEGVKGRDGVIGFDVDSNQTREMILNHTGLGIGVSPSTNLHVQGNAIISGKIKVGGMGTASSNLDLSGSMSLSFQSVNSDTTLGESSIVLVDSSSDNIKITLPYAGNVTGRIYHIKRKNTSNQVWITADNTIDGFDYLSLNQSTGVLANIKVMSYGQGWYRLSENNVSEPWTPSQLTTSIWLDANDSDTISANVSNQVDTWSDKSGNSNDFTQSNSNNKPLLTEINGKGVLQFDGSTDSMSSAAQLQNIVSSGNEVSIYFAIPSKTLAAGLFHARGTARVQVRGEGQWFIGTYAGADPGVSGLSSFIAGMQRDDSNNVSFSVNGTFSSNTYVDTTSLQDNPTVNIGTSDGSYFNGLYGELVVLPSHLSISDRQKLEGYMAHKWGLEGDLDTNHPYKIIPPFE